jgi:hypothetical protein
MIRPHYATQKVIELSALPRFPSDQDARLMICRTLLEMVRFAGHEVTDTWGDIMRKDQEALDWLVQRACNLWNKWEGIRELRAIYCARYRPGDGIESTSAIYTDGVPPDPLLPRLALPAPADLKAWPKEELEAIGKAWAQRNRLSPAEQRRQTMRAWMEEQKHDVIVLDSIYDDALIGMAVLASDPRTPWAVYDTEALMECLMDREGLSPGKAAESVANLTSEVLLFYRPPGEQMRPKVLTRPVTQEEIDRAVAVTRARREGWTPERVAEIQAEAERRGRTDE